jgi:hypothetical protein
MTVTEKDTIEMTKKEIKNLYETKYNIRGTIHILKLRDVTNQ